MGMSEQWMFMSGGFKADPVLMVRGNGNCIAVIHKGDGIPKSMDRQRAEAALVAAAPELQDALETLLMAVEVDKVKGIGHATDKAKAVLAKAKVGGFVPAPVGLLDAAKQILVSYEHACGNYVGRAYEEGGRFAAGYIEGIGQAADLLRPHIAEAEGDL
jgi:hypothetical protein